MRALRRPFGLIAIVLLLWPLPSWSVPARAQTAQAVGLEITPAQTELDIPSRQYSTTLTLINHDPTTYNVKLSLAALGHDLDGVPQYLPSTVVTNAFSLDVTSFSLRQGQRKKVNLKGAIPAGDRSIYFGVLADYARADQQAGSSVETHSRLASEFLLRGPKPWIERLQVADVGALPGPGKSVTVYAIVKNVGNVHVRPTGTFTVSSRSRSVVTLAFALNAAHRPGAVIPGFARRYTAVWTPPAGFSGTFTVTAVTNGPVARGSKEISFANGRALVPDAKIASLSLQNLSAGLMVDSVVRNQGGAALTGAKLTLVATQDGKFERGRTVIALTSLAAGASIDKRWLAGKFSNGVYQVTATLAQGTTLLDQRVAGLRIGASPGKSARGPWLAAAGGLLALLIGIVVWFLLAKRRDREEEERARSTAG